MGDVEPASAEDQGRFIGVAENGNVLDYGVVDNITGWTQRTPVPSGEFHPCVTKRSKSAAFYPDIPRRTYMKCISSETESPDSIQKDIPGTFD